MPGYYYSWNGPNGVGDNHQNPNRCHLHKKSKFFSGFFYLLVTFFIEAGWTRKNKAGACAGEHGSSTIWHDTWLDG